MSGPVKVISLPSVRNSTFQHRSNEVIPIGHTKTPKIQQPAPQNVVFPTGHATFPPSSPQSIALLNTLQVFTETVTESLFSFTSEETSSSPPSSETEVPIESYPKVPIEKVPLLRAAFETLLQSLQPSQKLPFEVFERFPEAIKKAVQEIPVFLEQLRQVIERPTIRRVVAEEAELPILLPKEIGEKEKNVLREIETKLAPFLKTLQEVVRPPIAEQIPLPLRESLEQYLASPVVKQALPLPKPQPEETKEKGKALLPPEVPVLLHILPEKPLEQTERLLSENIPVPPPEVSQEEKQAAIPVPLPKESPAPLPGSPVIPETEVPLSAPVYPKSSFEELLQNISRQFFPIPPQLLQTITTTYPVSENILHLLETLSSFAEILLLLAKRPIKTLGEQEISRLRNFLLALPSVLEALKREIPLLPENIPEAIRFALQKYVQTFPAKQTGHLTEELFPASIKKPLSPTIEKESVVRILPKEKPEVTLPNEIKISPKVSTPSLIVPEIPFFSEISSPELQEELILEVYPHYKKGGKEVGEIERETRGVRGTAREAKEEIPSPKILPVVIASQIPERVPAPGKPMPEFSTEIPFAFIVPYVPNTPIHTPPPEVTVTASDPWKETHRDSVEYEIVPSLQIMTYIPAGEAWIGNPDTETGLEKIRIGGYGIGIYPVTNGQFADFLTVLSKAGGVIPGQRGEVYSKDKTLLCMIGSGLVESDIESDPEAKFLRFQVKSGKESYPVIGVTYFGAKAFCEATGFRLPTEAEWEKAASCKTDEKNRVIGKCKYGSGSDLITPSHANYGMAGSSREALTTPVGIYNGRSSFMRGGELIRTYDSKSPFGCYDMSGNVREWTDTGGENRKIVKGGYYGSSPDAITTWAREKEQVDHCDAKTGFRVAVSR